MFDMQMSRTQRCVQCLHIGVTCAIIAPSFGQSCMVITPTDH